MNIINYKNTKNLDGVVSLLREGKLVVYPTDTIYGIAADINNIDAIKKIYVTKNRSNDKAISICFHDINQLKDYVYINDKIQNILNKLLPGTYTLLLNKKNNVNPLLTSNSDIVGVRIPNNEIAYKLTEYFPITTTSANLSNYTTPNNVNDIYKQLKENISVYIDYGVLDNNMPSTIIDLTKDNPIIIRKGVCDEKLLKEILNISLI